MERQLSFLLLAMLWSGCGQPTAPSPLRSEDFSGECAMTHVQRLVAYGPRISGSAAAGRASTYLAARLEEYGWEVREQVFLLNTPRGPVQFRNVLGKSAKQSAGPRNVIIIGSHYDTKRLDNPRFVGANDGGSSSGVLLEIARVAAQEPDLWLVFFDGEEALVEYGPKDGLYGSRSFIRQIQSDGTIARVKAMILLDMVGDANLNITIPPNTTGELAQQVFFAATTLGYRDFFHYAKTEILDDHVPFLEAGIPSVNLIDYEYGSAPGQNDYWHTEQDTLDKLSARSLEITGKTVLQMIRSLRGGSEKIRATTPGTPSP